MSPSTSAIQVRAWPGSRRSASSKILPMVTSRPAVMSQAYQRFTARGAFLPAPGSGRMTCSGVRAGRPARPGRRRRRRSRSRPSACSLSSPRSRPACRRSVPSGPGPSSGGGAPPGSIATPLPSAEIASGGRRSCWSCPAPARPALILEPVLAEPLRVRGRGHDDLLQLPLADGHPGRRVHELVPLLIRHGPAEHLRQPLQRPGIPARRQVQHRIAREQRLRPLDPGPVRDPPHPHLTQPRHDRTVMTALSPGPRHPVPAGHPRQPDLTLSLGIQAQLNQPAQQLPALLDDQHFHRIQRHRPARLTSKPRQPGRQRPQPRHHRIRTRRQRIQPVLFHLRLPFRSPGIRTSGPYGTEASLTHRHATATGQLTPEEPHPCRVHVALHTMPAVAVRQHAGARARSSHSGIARTRTYGVDVPAMQLERL